MRPQPTPAEGWVSFEQDYVRAEIHRRQTAAETREFLESVAAAALSHGCWRVLIWVRHSKAVFRVEGYGLSQYFQLMARQPTSKVALLGDSDEVCASHEYIEVLARQSGVQVRSFRSEIPALDWLRSG